MKRPVLSHGDRRALRIGMLLLGPMLTYALLVRPYVRTLGDTRTRLADERALLAREHGLVRDAPRFPDRRRRASMALGATWTRIIRGADTISIAASLAGYVSTTAEDAGLLVEQVESRGADSAGNARLAGVGLAASTVELRARGDLVRVLRFLAEMETGETFARIERIHIAKTAGPGDADDQETLSVTATVTGIARVLARPASFRATPTLAREPRAPVSVSARSSP